MAVAQCVGSDSQVGCKLALQPWRMHMAANREADLRIRIEICRLVYIRSKSLGSPSKFK